MSGVKPPYGPQTPDRMGGPAFPGLWHPALSDEDSRKLLKLILDKLNSIEKRLEQMEKLLAQQPR